MRASESCHTAAIPAMKLRRPQPTILWTHLDSLDHGTKDKEVIFRLARCKNHTSSLYVTATGNGKHVRVVAVAFLRTHLLAHQISSMHSVPQKHAHRTPTKLRRMHMSACI